MSGIKLTYFDGRGRAELSRLVLAAAGQKYEDVRLTFEQWGGGEKAKARFNGLPNLLYKGKTYGQSMAIAAFLGKEFGLYGKSNEEALRIDEVMQIIVDIRTALMNANFEKDPAKKEELLKKCKESLPRNLKYLEEVAVANGKKGFFLNAKLSIADLALFDAWVSVKNAMPEADTGKDYPELKKILRSVETTATIKTYLANRKETSF